ncbi:hypothetical protein K431DRAFT_336151 [Polychaeton citri CBS 116435]|uniref:Altered inheritance of mitochondria protein 9, mitochondrial n=1 Tax=Polychaeton citri CBS 116435 TaxID=1314669 RepID=A0A9P4QFU6_9PEZI|nr:hypothetical protein K431DRAFT_336151 [Polychaeton citri CBS 116435]
MRTFFRYTSGRWLWDEHARLEERYRRFNVTALQQIAASSVGAEHCISMNKLAEGGFNKIFRLVMIMNTGPLFHTVASEVATMDFASNLITPILDIPVPKVLSYDAKADNPVQSEYMLIEEASGIQLGNIWSSMDTEAKAEVVEQMVSIANKLLSASFSWYVSACGLLNGYGNIYFSANKFPGCEPATKGAVVCNRYVIGPVTERSFWDGERAGLPGVHGPCNKYANFQEKTKLPFQPLTQRSPEKHIALYQKFRAASEYLLPPDPELLRSTLWHWGMHALSILVTGNKITSIIDWQDCWAGPLMLQARRPRLVGFQGDLKLQLPPQCQYLEEGPEKKQIRSNVKKSLLLFSYESQIQRANPELDRLFLLSQGATIRDTVLFAANSWDGGIVSFRQSLIRIFRHWKKICPNQECPFTFTQDELDDNTNESVDWNENAEFWSSISGLALEMFAKLREDGLQTLRGNERAEFDQATTWAVRRI